MMKLPDRRKNMNYQELFSTIFIIIAGLVVVVNLITEVAKKIYTFKETIHINAFVTVLSIALTVAVFVAYWQIKRMKIAWYLLVAFVIIGFMVAYAAMFGFDKLIKQIKHFQDLKK